MLLRHSFEGPCESFFILPQAWWTTRLWFREFRKKEALLFSCKGIKEPSLSPQMISWLTSSLCTPLLRYATMDLTWTHGVILSLSHIWVTPFMSNYRYVTHWTVFLLTHSSYEMECLWVISITLHAYQHLSLYCTFDTSLHVKTLRTAEQRGRLCWRQGFLHAVFNRDRQLIPGLLITCVQTCTRACERERDPPTESQRSRGAPNAPPIRSSVF